MRTVNKQLAIKPQDLLVAIKLKLLNGKPFTYAAIAEMLAMSISEVHASLSRAQLARLVTLSDGGLAPNPSSLLEFVVHGLKYAFPAVLGPTVRGIVTAYGAEPLRSSLASAEESPVWPYTKGDARGPALYPLYPTVPIAALRDQDLYETLALIDALRIGAARERNVAVKLLSEKLL